MQHKTGQDSKRPDEFRLVATRLDTRTQGTIRQHEAKGEMKRSCGRKHTVAFKSCPKQSAGADAAVFRSAGEDADDFMLLVSKGPAAVCLYGR